MSQEKTIPGINTLYLAFYSKGLYRDVARNWKGFCFPYLLLILTVYWVPEMMNFHRMASDFISDDAPKYVEQMPEITIANGRASIQEPVPFIIQDRKSNKPLAIIDTSGEITSLNNSEAAILITSDQMILKMDQQNTRSIPLSEFGDRKITRKSVYEGMSVLSTFLITLAFPFVLLVSFGFHIVQTLLLALLGGNFAKFFGLDFDFRTLVRLSVVAFTPAILLEAVHAMLNIQYPYSTFLSFIITAGYLFYAIGANSEKALTAINGRS